MTILRALTALSSVALFTAGCGGSTNTDVAAGNSAGVPTGTDAPAMTDRQSPPNRVVIDVTIAGGKVTPANQQVQAEAKEPIIVRANSDAVDQLHVNSTPEHNFDIKAENGQAFQFTVDAPGKVEVQLRHLNRTVATITVQ